MTDLRECDSRLGVILCGGYGTRVRSIDGGLPKALMTFEGSPILSHVITMMCELGVSEIVCAAGFRARLIQQFLDHNSFDVPVGIEVENSPQGTGGAFLNIVRANLRDTYIVANADTVFSKKFSRQRIQGVDNFLLCSKSDQSRFSSVDADDTGFLKSFNRVGFESQLKDTGVWGVSAKSLGTLDWHCLENRPLDFSKIVECLLDKGNKFRCLEIDGSFRDLGVVDEWV